MRRISLSVFICTAFFVAQSFGGKPPPKPKCAKYTPIDINDAWFFDFAEKGMDNPMGTKYMIKQGLQAPKQPAENTTLKHKMCMTATYKLLIQKVVLTVVFKYDRINAFKAYVQTEGTPADKVFKLYGDFVMTKTDNKTYVLFFGCNFGTDPFWQVHSPIGTELSNKTKTAIFAHLEKHGFSTAEDDISNPEDDLWLERAVIAGCSGNALVSTATGNVPKDVPAPPKEVPKVPTKLPKHLPKPDTDGVTDTGGATDTATGVLGGVGGVGK